VRRAGGSGEIVVRLGSGFWSKETIARSVGWICTMAVRTNTAG
jgi:hypothetical protein